MSILEGALATQPDSCARFGAVVRVRMLVRSMLLTGLLVLLCGCAAVKERREIDAEAEAADAVLESTSRDEALLEIVRARQSRSDTDTLLKWARHHDARARREAIRALGLVGDPTLQGAIEAGLQDEAAEVRAAAAFAVSQIWGWPLADLERVTAEAQSEVSLDAALADELSLLRRGEGSKAAASAMIRGLGEVGDTPTEDTLWDLASHPDLGTPALFALGMRGRRDQAIPAERVPVLEAALSTNAAFAAAWAVGRSPVAEDARSSLEPVLLTALEAADEDTAAWLLRALGKTGGAAAIERWTLELSGDDARRRLNAVRGASVAGAVDVLLLAATDADPQVATEALTALGKHPGDAVLAALQPIEGRSALEEAARLRSWAKVAPDGVVEAAQAALSDERPEVRGAACEVLATLEGAEETLLAHLETEDDARVRITLAASIADSDALAYEGQLLAWLDGADPVLGQIAADGLAERTDDHVTAALLQAWKAHATPADWERRVSIVRAVAPRESVPPDFYGEALADANPHVRLAAFFALAKRAGRSQAGAPPLGRPVPDVSDAWFGVADVERAVVTTSEGVLTLLLYPKTAPEAVASFVRLAEQGFFDGVVFHRVVPDFVVQTGDPTHTGWGGPGYTLADEFSPLEYRRGTLGMARSDKDTAGSQWFITHSPQPHLTGHYTAFGQLMTGWDTLDALRQGGTVESIRIERKAPK